MYAGWWAKETGRKTKLEKQREERERETKRGEQEEERHRER